MVIFHSYVKLPEGIMNGNGAVPLHGFRQQKSSKMGIEPSIAVTSWTRLEDFDRGSPFRNIDVTKKTPFIIEKRPPNDNNKVPD